MPRTNFKKQLEQLNDQMITMGSMIENAIETAIAALVSQDTERAEEAIAYDMEVDAQELQERFVRGDKSRHKEGNGLGLSIAISLAQLQRGNLKIVTDGDLFKAILEFPLKM